jgi:streptogramin lyase
MPTLNTGLIRVIALITLLSLSISLASASVRASPPADSAQSYLISQYPLPTGSTQPSQITSEASGRIWFVEQGSNQIGSFDSATRTFAEYDIPTANALPEGIAVDQNGEVWFTELTPNGLGVLTPGNGSIHEVTLPAGPLGLGCGPIGVTPQRNGSIWVTCEFSNQLDEYVPSLHVVREFNLPVALSAPLQILFDNAGNFWFTAADAGMIGYVDVGQLRPGTSDGIEEFAPLNGTYVNTIEDSLLPSGKVITSLAIPSQIALSPDGKSLWVTEHGGSSFDRYSIGARTLTKYFTSAPGSDAYTTSLPNGLAVDAAGDVWIAEHYGNRVADFDPQSGSMVEYPIPCCSSGIAGTLYLALGANGTVWFTESFGNAIGELAPAQGVPPATITLNPPSVDMGATSSATVSVVGSWGNGSREAGQGLTFHAAGVTTTGSLRNLTATFLPTNPTIKPSRGPAPS